MRKVVHTYEQISLDPTAPLDDKQRTLLKSQLASNVDNFMKLYEAKQTKLAKLTAKGKELVCQNIDQKKKLVKKQCDMTNVMHGRPVESDDPFHVFLKQMAKERERKRKADELAEKKHK